MGHSQVLMAKASFLYPNSVSAASFHSVASTIHTSSATVHNFHQPTTTASPKEIMKFSEEALMEISHMTGGFPVGRAKHPCEFKVNDSRRHFCGSCSPLPLVCFASSGQSGLLCKVLPRTLPQLLEDDAMAKQNASTSPFDEPMNLTFVSENTSTANLQVYGHGLNAESSNKKFTSLTLSGACHYDYDVPEDYIEKGVRTASVAIINDALKRTTYNSDRVLIGVVRKLTTGDLHVFKSETEKALAGIKFQGHGLDLSSLTGEIDHTTSKGVVALHFMGYIFDRAQPRKGEKSPWNVSKPIFVNSFDDPLFHKALDYCAKPPKWGKKPFALKLTTKKNALPCDFVVDYTFEGPKRCCTLEEDRFDRTLASAAETKSIGTTGAQRTGPTMDVTPATERPTVAFHLSSNSGTSRISEVPFAHSSDLPEEIGGVDECSIGSELTAECTYCEVCRGRDRRR